MRVLLGRRSMSRAATSRISRPIRSTVVQKPSIKSDDDDASETKPAPSTRKGYWIISGVAIYCFTTYGFYLYRSYQASVAQSQQLDDVSEDVSGRYDVTAATFDRDVEVTEWLMGMGRLRKRLARKASGDVLEVSAGTGRNLRYYPLQKLDRLTLVDKSRPMLERARDKFILLRTSGHFPKDSYKKVDFLVQDATQPIITSQSSSAGFDTVIQTMGLCSTAEPVKLLRHLGSLTNQDHGQILLLEHGRSHYSWLNNILDSLAKGHAKNYGCWWNRDVGKIIEESGLEVVKLKRYHLGTTWWVELRPIKRTK